ncbi:MAG: hypothetical protein QM500_17740 [Methylococcales bacterium]
MSKSKVEEIFKRIHGLSSEDMDCFFNGVNTLKNDLASRTECDKRNTFIATAIGNSLYSSGINQEQSQLFSKQLAFEFNRILQDTQDTDFNLLRCKINDAFEFQMLHFPFAVNSQ